MGDEDVDVAHAVLLERVRARDQRPAGHRAVVADDCDLVAHAAGDFRHRDDVVRGTCLVHDRKVGVDHLGEAHGLLGASGVGRDRHHALPVQA